MDEITQGLNLTATSVCEEIEEFIRNSMHNLHRDGAVVSLSGGLDSAVAATLSVGSLGTEKVHLLNMPERDSKPIHKQHARLLANHLGISLLTKSLTPLLRASGSYKLLPIGYIPFRRIRTMLVNYGKSKFLADRQDHLLADRLEPEPNSWFARGNAYAIAKHRMRMVMVYQYAEIHNLMVVGAANRTEWLTGTFSKWGVDHCADIMPLLHLYRSQLELIAEHINVPEPIRGKAADPDVMPGIDDKGGLLGDFAVVDQVLMGLENNFDRDKLIQEYGKELVLRIIELHELSKHMRESPYHIETRSLH
jgi:NAD+ synthase